MSVVRKSRSTEGKKFCVGADPILAGGGPADRDWGRGEVWERAEALR